MSKSSWRPIELQPQFRDQPIHHAVHSWMQDMTLDRLIELWWEAQAIKATKIEEHRRRVADPDNMTGKSAEYVNAYFARKREQEQGQ